MTLHRRLRLVFLPALVLALALAPAASFAQSTGTTTGDIRGRILDDKGLPLPGVSVSATNRDTGATRSSVAAVDGDYGLVLLPPGAYTVKAELSGFTPAVLENVRVSLGATTLLDIPLRLAQTASAAVEVTADTPLLDPTKTDVSSTIDRNQIEKLPNVARNFLSFSFTTPRVSEDRGPQTGAASTSGFSINGQSPRYNNLAVDGFDNNDQASGSVRGTFSQDAVQEYQVITNPYAPEYGRTAGGVINIVTRSGTNEFKGGLFYFYRGDSLSAKDPLTSQTVPLKDHRFGASLGGPLIKDRTFFFAAFERQQTDTANPVTITDADVALLKTQGFDIQNGNVPFEVRQNSLVAKVDHSFSPAHLLTVRGNWSKGLDENQQAWGGQTAKSAGGVRDSRDTSGALGLTSIFGSQSFNELRVLYSDASYVVAPLDETYRPSIQILGVATFGTQRFLPSPRDAKIFQAFDAFSFQPAAHLRLKLGFEYNRFQLEGTLPNLFAGLYRFGALPAPFGLDARQAFVAGQPQVFVQAFGDPTGSGNAQQISGFLQSEIDLGARFLLRLGVRYDYEIPFDPFPKDTNNFAPRVSFSWGVSDDVKIKGGYGRFFGVSAVGPMFAVNVERDGSQVRRQTRIIGQGPQSVWPAVPWRILPDRRFPSEAASGVSPIPPSVLRAGDFESAQTDQASFGIEASPTKKLLLSVDGVWARGQNVFINRNVNPVIAPATQGRPDPRFRDIFVYESTGNSWYAGVTLGAQARLSSLNLSAYYTYAKAEDDYVDWLTDFQPQDPLHPEDERGPSVQSPDQKLSVTAVYTTPQSMGAFLRDWTVATIVDWRNGIHYNILAGVDRNLNGDAASDRPLGVGRNAGSLGSQFSLDLRLSRLIPIGDRFSVELIAVCTNITNNENVLSRQNVANLPSFGDPTFYGPGRIFQLGTRLGF